MKKIYKITFYIIALVVIIVSSIYIAILNEKHTHEFNSQHAYDYIKYQVELGPRTMGSAAHDQVVSWLTVELQNMTWPVEIQEAVINGVQIKNIIAKRGTGEPWIILASHYDSRTYADKDPIPANRRLPVPGANDGASSVAVLLELARILPARLDKQVWLVFFDDEDNGTALGTGWSIGSRYFVSQLQGKPSAVVVLDMVGNKDLNISMEQNSNPEINTEIWDIAQQLGYAQFIPKYKHSVIDDHLPFIETGIRAVDVIDLDYPYWHTTSDTLDKISADSLKAVGNTVLKWLEQYPK